MGDLAKPLNPFKFAKRTIKDTVHAVGDVFESMKEGSKKIGEVLGYEKAGVTPKSDATKRKLAAAIPPVIPMPDEEDLRRQRRRRLSGQAQAAGRASTILSQDDDQLG